MDAASFIVLLAKAYVVVGLVVGLAFVLVGVDRVDQHARGAYAFRPLLLPGFALIWPLAAARWMRARAAARRRV